VAEEVEAPAADDALPGVMTLTSDPFLRVIWPSVTTVSPGDTPLLITARAPWVEDT
jgi:hypothetical protein